MKNYYVLFLSLILSQCAIAQVVNKKGGIETNSINMLDKNGAIGSGYGVDKNGKMNFFQDGKTRGGAAISALKIKQDYPSSGDGVYWIDVPGVGPKQTYCLMDSKYDGGGWMLALKATTGTTFNYDADYWTTSNTLNSTDVTRNDADAKYDVMNGFQAMGIMALWPDISAVGNESGSIDGLNQWSWLESNFNNGIRTTLISKFSGAQVTAETSMDGTIYFSGYKTGIFGSQPGFSFYGFNYTSGTINRRVRWGVSFNQEADQLSNDVIGGIGMSGESYSAGDVSSDGQWETVGGINRSARVEIYIR